MAQFKPGDFVFLTLPTGPVPVWVHGHRGEGRWFVQRVPGSEDAPSSEPEEVPEDILRRSPAAAGDRVADLRRAAREAFASQDLKFWEGEQEVTAGDLLQLLDLALAARAALREAGACCGGGRAYSALLAKLDQLSPPK